MTASKECADWVGVHATGNGQKVWVIGPDRRVLSTALLNSGTAGVEGFVQPYLADERITPVVWCGPFPGRKPDFQQVPCPPPSGQTARPQDAHDPRLRFHVLPGLSQQAPPDIMQGPETQIAGFLHSQPTFDGVLCLIGDQTIWAHISASEVVSFRSFMTYELLSALVWKADAGETVELPDAESAAFMHALSGSMTRPEQLASRLSGVRAASVLENLSLGNAFAQFAGTLIGAELAAARPFWLGQNVVILGQGNFADLYKAGLGELGVMAEVSDSQSAALHGLGSACKQAGLVRA